MQKKPLKKKTGGNNEHVCKLRTVKGDVAVPCACQAGSIHKETLAQIRMLEVP